jgi:titin
VRRARYYRPSVESLERRELPSTYTVTSPADSGPGTLRQAILDTDTSSGPYTINFDLQGLTTIKPTSPLPGLGNNTIIDGTTQPGYAGTPLVVLDGSSAGTYLDGSGIPGLEIIRGGGTIRGLAIDHWSGPGILLEQASNEVITGNYIGTDATGTLAAGNNAGVEVFNRFTGNDTIGGTAVGAGNLIAYNNTEGILVGAANTTIAGNVIVGNRVDGVLVRSSLNTVQGNFIGTDATGSAAFGNTNGVVIESSNNMIGGPSLGAGNVISGNTNYGVAVLTYSAPSLPTGNLIEGNDIGTNASGTAALPNLIGVFSNGGFNNTIGGVATGAGNLISGNTDYGIAFLGSPGYSTANLIQGNRIGTDQSGDTSLPNSIGVLINGAGNATVGGTAAADGNLISGNSQFGVDLQSPGTTLQGNLIGTDAAGTAALPNGDGIVSSAASNTIGGTQSGAGNLISGNTNDGIELLPGASSNQVLGNTIGTDPTGSTALGNYYGVYVYGASSNTIGGSAAGNLISGNRQYGLALSGIGASQNQVLDNFIGTDRGGDAALPNVIGVIVNGAANNTIGGGTTATRNLISGNTLDGIVISNSGATANTVTGNYIGVNAAGTVALSNGVGIQMASAPSNTIGGTAAGAGNLISGNFWYGVQITGATATGNLLEGNVIGLSANHSNSLSSKVGVYLLNASNNTIGGTTSGAGNIIAENGWGVRISGGTGDAILGNSIFGNTVLGIQLLNGGDNNQPAPVLSSATNAGGITTVSGTLTAAANTTYTLEFFWTPAHYATGADVQGKTFLLRVQVTTNANGVATFSIPLPLQVPAGDFVTATATDPNDDTSQFSNGVQVS